MNTTKTNTASNWNTVARLLLSVSALCAALVGIVLPYSNIGQPAEASRILTLGALAGLGLFALLQWTESRSARLENAELREKLVEFERKFNLELGSETEKRPVVDRLDAVEQQLHSNGPEPKADSG